MTAVTISLPNSLKTFVDRQVTTKGYGNVSEYLCSLLRDAQKAEAEAQEALLLEGLESGEDTPLTPVFWEQIRSEARQFIASRRQHKPLG
jgi:antitoxin ParD1/3/4